MGHFIRHVAGSEPRTHHGGGKAAVRALLKASAVGRTARYSGLARTARCFGFGQCPTWGDAPMWGGALAWGATPTWGGGWHGAVLWRGVVLRRRGGRGWRGVEMNWDNFNPRHFYSSELITAGSACKPTVMGHITAGSLPKPTVM